MGIIICFAISSLCNVFLDPIKKTHYPMIELSQALTHFNKEVLTMRTEQIRYLYVVHRCASLHKASDALHISTQALSLSIRSLEKELGFTILNRSRTGVSLTEKGEQLLDIGLDFLRQLEHLQNMQRKKYESILTGDLEVMATSGVLETIFPPLISQLISDYPSFRLKPLAREFDEILESLLQKNIELGLVYQVSINKASVTPYNPSIFGFSFLLSGSYYCTVPENHPIAHYKSVSLNTMAKYPIILFTPTSNVLLKLFSGITTHKIVLADSFAIYKQLLKDGVGLGMTLVLSDSDIPMVAFPNMKFIPFREHIDSNLGFLYRKNIDLSPKAEAFISYLTEYLYETPPTTLSVI